jgi:zinc protease
MIVRRTILVSVLFLQLALSAATSEKVEKLDWSKQPPVGPEPIFKVPIPVRFQLTNGLTVLPIENHKLPLVAMSLVVPGAGSAADPRGQAGLAAFTADLLDESAGPLGALQISELQNQLGSRISTSTGVDASFVDVQALAKNFDSTLDLFTTIVTQPSFDPTETARVHHDRLTHLKLRRDRPREIATMLFNETLYGAESGYGHPSSGYVNEFERLDAAAARHFYERAWDPAEMILVVAGDITPEALRAKIEPRLAKWRRVAKERLRQTPSNPVQSDTRLVLIDRPDAAQSDTHFGLIGINRANPRRAAFEVAVEVLGGGFTGRFTQRLREQLGYIYHIYAHMEFRRGLGPFSVSAAFFTPKTVDGIKESIEMVRELGEKEVPDQEFRKTKQNMMRGLPQQFETNQDIVAAYTVVALEHLPLDWYDRWLKEVSQVSGKDVRVAAHDLLADKRLLFVVVGAVPTVRPGLEALGLGTPKEYDLDGTPIK